jgi:aspartate racemase
MKRAGLIGGMSWESTAIYYRLMNTAVAARLGGHHSADLVLASVDFAPIEAWGAAGQWQRTAAHLAATARDLERAGAEFLVLCTNTMHKVAPAIEAQVSVPLLHIAAPTVATCARLGYRRVGLLGTRFTMEDEFYRGTLEGAGLAVVVPDATARQLVHRIIYDELCHGTVDAGSRRAVEGVIESLAGVGVDAVILGCTELGLLLERGTVPLLDTTALHAAAAVDFALG